MASETQLRWLPIALDDRESIFQFIAQDKPLAALGFMDRLGAEVEGLRSRPLTGRSGRVRGTREMVVSRSQYIVVYRVTGRLIEILRIVNGMQESWLHGQVESE